MEQEKTGFTALERAMQGSRAKKQSENKIEKPAHARFHCMYYWHGQKEPKTMYSLDTMVHGQSTHQDEHEGLIKILKWLNKEHDDGVITTAKVWATRDPQKDTEKKTYDLQVVHITVNRQVLHPDISFENITHKGKTHTYLEFNKIEENYFTKKGGAK